MALYVGGTSLLLHGNGADGSTVFTDETGKTVTAYGNARISTAQSKFGGASAYFDGTGDYLTCTDATLVFGTGDFTIACFIYLPSTPIGSFAAIVDIRSAGIAQAGSVLFHVNSSRQLGYWSFALVSAANALPLNAWVHCAICRKLGVTQLFIDGIVVGSVADTGDKVASQCMIGAVYDGANPAFNGYIDDLHIIKGIALYTSAFTPPTAPADPFTAYATIQAQDIGLAKLAKYDPSQVKPVMQEVADDLQDRMPYGLWQTPAVVSELKGRGVISGTVKVFGSPDNVPLGRLVRLHREPDGMFVRATWSDPITGAYTFNGVRPDCKYSVTSFDYQHGYRAVIADNLSATPL